MSDVATIRYWLCLLLEDHPQLRMLVACLDRIEAAMTPDEEAMK